MGNQRGSMMLLVAFLLAIALGAGGIYVIYSTTGSAEAPVTAEAQYENIRQRVEHALKDATALNYSVQKNSNSFSCLSSADSNCKGAGGYFLLFENADSPVSQLGKRGGLRADGAGCDSYPSFECPIRVEAKWEPICQSPYCEGTRSGRIKVKVSLHAEGAPQHWEKETRFNPQVELSQAVLCARDGKVWALSECLSHEEIAQRKLASGTQNPRAMQLAAPTAGIGQGQVVMPEEEVVCPSSLPIQGEYLPLEPISVNRARARYPAVNGCPGAEDIFTFQCQPLEPNARDGQWVQVEAQMAPGCDETAGNVVQEPVGPRY
jgi:hypothetical protein